MLAIHLPAHEPASFLAYVGDTVYLASWEPGSTAVESDAVGTLTLEPAEPELSNFAKLATAFSHAVADDLGLMMLAEQAALNLHSAVASHALAAAA